MSISATKEPIKTTRLSGKEAGRQGGEASFIHQDNRLQAIQQQQMQQASRQHASTSQLKACADIAACSPLGEPVKQLKTKANNTGLPNQLKSGIESLSGVSLDQVKVHYNSSKPAQMQAHAYAQGTDIHIASGQEKHLPHEAWHVVQQAKGRVKPTTQMKGFSINDDIGLEKEADVMGAKALQQNEVSEPNTALKIPGSISQPKLIQAYSYSKGTTRKVKITGSNSSEREFEECTYNKVEFNAGDPKRDGSGTGTAAWAGWLVNKKGGNNATQLHVVNRRWGGLGGKDDGNILPGTPAENSHHLHQAEKKFDDCFDGSNRAINKCTYECTATPKYGTSVDVSGGNQEYGDPTLSVTITDGGVPTTYPVTDGAEGLVFKQGQ